MKMTNGSIGERVRALRSEKGLTLAELGGRVNLSTSYLSQIERDRTNPSLTTLMSIARALNVEPRHFFESGDDAVLVQRADRAPRPETVNSGMECYPLSPQGTDNNLKVYRVVLQPDAPLQEFDLYSGEEMCFVLCGELAVVAGEETYILQAGDSIHYDALLPHSWRPQGDQPCEVIWSQASY